MDAKVYNNAMTLLRFEGPIWAVFNCNERDRGLAKKVFCARFSSKIYSEKIFPFVKNGIMAIFDAKNDRFTGFYVAVLADIADARHFKIEQKLAKPA